MDGEADLNLHIFMVSWACIMITEFEGYSFDVDVVQESRMKENFPSGLTRVQ